ncbi:MAG: TOTE conflict system archaeo-eukaryotic primase domain-containing protein [Acidimicrobiales bacterium]
MNDEELQIVDELRHQIADLQRENDRLAEILEMQSSATAQRLESSHSVESPLDFPLFQVDRTAPPEAKVDFFRALFVGRDDVYAVRWESERTGKYGWSPAVQGGFANARSPSKEYLPLTQGVIADHLAGKIHVGLYPLLRDDSCRLLVCDFDGPGWALDALAYFNSAKSIGITPALERSRSGDGAHVWIFFRETVPATLARRLGTLLLREAMNLRGELDLASYDRLFPAQDFMPKGSFGNLIALPLQKECRDSGTTTFLDPGTMKPLEDQWAHLSTLKLVSRAEVELILETAPAVGAGPEERTFQRSHAVDSVPMPEVVVGVAAAMLEIERSGLPSRLLSALKHLASLHNPAFYEKERLRFSTWDTPRMIRCYGETLESLLLPRGLSEKAASVVAEAGSRLLVHESRPDPDQISFAPTFELRGDQEAALHALSPHELGVLVAAPGAGKTVVACALIAHHRLPTLIIVDRKPLVEQWTERLATHLGLAAKEIGQIGGGRNKITGIVDIAMAQSLARREDLEEMSSHYGLVIVDECHHVPAVTFERCVKQIRARRWLGLTATPYRRDGLQGLISMYCGPIRHRMDEKVDAGNDFSRKLIVHQTSLEVSDDLTHIQDLFRALVDDEARTMAICDDVVAAAENGRNCLVLTQWTEHLSLFVSTLISRGITPLVLQGGMGKKARAKVMAELDEASKRGGLVLAATGSFLGEGFDCPPLDTVFMAFPIAFRGRVVQYVGRILRPLDGKSSVEVHDYVDAKSPVLARMHRKRLPGYATLGFDVGPHRKNRTVVK